VWLPANYDPNRAYPLVFTFHGCGSPDNFVPMQKQTGADAILVRGTGITQNCWTYGGDGDDVKVFRRDAGSGAGPALHRHLTRFSPRATASGSWLVNTLECVRGDQLRATGTVSGGVVGNRGSLQGQVTRASSCTTPTT